LTSSEVGKTITVTASYKDQLATNESVKSIATEKVVKLIIVIKGTTGDDVLQGDDTDNSFAVSEGNDVFYGKLGTDTVNYTTKLSDIKQVGVSEDLSTIIIKLSDTKTDYLDNIETVSFAGTNISPTDLAKVSQATPLFSVSTANELPYTLPTNYTGTVEGLEYELLGNAIGDIISGSSGNDFINFLGGDDAVNAGAGDDVIDGGTGSNFLSGGAGKDTFFVDGRGGSTTWSTITDWETGEQLSLWGWNPDVSTSFWEKNAGAEGFKGATLHADLDANGVTDISVTWAGLTQDQIVTPTEFSDPQLLWFT
jgi:serralysin